MQIRRGAQVVRAFTIAAAAILFASLAHTIGGGTPPGLVTIAVALAFSVPSAILIVGSRQSTPRAALAAVIAQLALHALYSLTPRTGLQAAVPATGHPHHHSDSAGMVVLTGSPVHEEHFGPAMLVAHMIAAVLTVSAVVLADQVQRALRFAASGIRSVWALLTVALVSPLRAHLAPAAPRVVGSNATSLLCTALRYRGPPRLTLAALAANR
ncbi:hypothetical protein [Agromyces sp. NPDC056965]|uniref:hypothetical protein n=1 Tax=Agromyces sp. NPDC056965 TaxID=3345983 RepID=UPI003643DCC5